MSWKTSLGEKLRKERLSAGMSLRGLAEIADVSPETLRLWEEGTRTPDADKLAKLALVLRIKEFDLGEVRFTVSQNNGSVKDEKNRQLNLDFADEYRSSQATVKIRSGSISVTFTGLKAINGG